MFAPRIFFIYKGMQPMIFANLMVKDIDIFAERPWPSPEADI